MIKILRILKSEYLFLAVILVVALTVRIYKIDNPIADWHAWRQADTAAVARNFYKEGYNPFVPKYDDMSGVAQFPIPNPNRYRFVEFPIYNSLVYFGYVLNGGVDERIARGSAALISLGSLVFVYLLTKKYFGRSTATLATILYAIVPYNIYYSRVVLPEPILVFFCLGMLYFADRWVRENTPKLFLLSFIFIAGAFLTKPYAVFYMIPLIYSYYQHERRWWPIPKRYFFLVIPALLPLLAWRIWINQHPEGIPASKWLLNGNHIRFKPVFWKWIIQDRLGREILTVPGVILLFFGVLKKPFEKEGYLLHILALSMILFIIVFATGNVQHDYYQYFIVPALVIFVARGAVLLFKSVPGFLPRLFTMPMVILFLFMMIYLGWGEIKGLYQINNPSIVEAGQQADKILPKDAVVVAPYNGDTSFLYQTNRVGWAVVGFPVKDLIDTFKVHYFISTAEDAKTAWVMRKYTVLIHRPNYVIIDLTHESSTFDRLHDIEPN